MLDRLVLIIPLEPALRRDIQAAFANNSAQVVVAAGPVEALQRVTAANFDLILLGGGAMLEDECSLSHRLRELVAAPILIVGGAEPSANLERALSQGADDFVLRPVRMSELFLRARVLGQRAAAPHRQAPPRTACADGRLQLDLDARRVSVGGEPVHLTPREFELLAYLYCNAGMVLTLRQILENVRGWECRGNHEYVHAYVNRLRRKLEPDPAHPVYLRSEFGIGYRFEHRPGTSGAPGTGGAPAAM